MYKCKQDQHNKCENSSLCHLCDGISLYKNRTEEFHEKMRLRDERLEAIKQADFRVHKQEKKEGMALEKEVARKWNAAYQKPQKERELFLGGNKKTKIQKPRIQLDEEITIIEETQPELPHSTVSLSSYRKPAIKESPVVDAKQQKNSGAMWYAKGDIITMDYLMECKERGTVNARGEKTISIPKAWLDKQEQEAFQENRHFWLLPFRYKNDETIYVVKTLDQEIEMYQELIRLREEIQSLKSNVVEL